MTNSPNNEFILTLWELQPDWNFGGEPYREMHIPKGHFMETINKLISWNEKRHEAGLLPLVSHMEKIPRKKPKGFSPKKLQSSNHKKIG